MVGNQSQIVVAKDTRGGKREGAGRPSILRRVEHDPLWLKARGVNALTAQEILLHVVDERRAWQRVFTSPDDRIVLQGLMFLTSMRDGKPSQQVNITSTHLSLNASDLEKARAIVREIRGELPPTQPSLGADVIDYKGVVKDSIMVGGDEGGI